MDELIEIVEKSASKNYDMRQIFGLKTYYHKFERTLQNSSSK